MIIRMRHVRGVTGFRRGEGLCMPSTREWCAKHNVNLRDFARNGMPEEQVLAIGDAFAFRVVEYARQEATDHG